MGCGASREAPAAAAAAAPSASRSPPEAATAASLHSKANSKSTAQSVRTAHSGDSSTAPSGLNSSRIVVANLNDVDRAREGARRNNRFLGYASGASSPNTSGNLSWDGQSDSRDSSDKDSTSGAAHGRSSKSTNYKTLKHSSSAIGLEDIHQSERAGFQSKVVHIEVPFGKPIEEVYDGVHNGVVLGSGVSGLVRLVTHKATGVQYAVKCLDLGLVGTKEGLSQLREEIFIMCQLDHPNIVRLEEVYESHSEIYLVQELCLGGELFDRLDEQPDYHYTEAECARLVKQMLSAVRYLHSKGIIHRDLKLENFLFSSKSKDSELKMIDFGLSKHFQYGEVHHEAVGTPYTVAPEVIQGCYDEHCDIWAIGVITFLLLSGDPPFGGCGGPEPLLTVRSNILSCKYSFEPEDIWGLVSSKAKDFVRAMLVIDPKLRPTAREAQKHPWLKEWARRQSQDESAVLNPNVVKALVNFKEFSHVRKLLSEVLSFTLLPDQIKDLRKEFEKMDTDGSGELSLAALKQVLVTNAGAGSLGALTEEEVEGIFNAMRVNKAETRIHWHEFIAAGISQCKVDDRNLRLAFDRLDGDHKGYITLDDIMNLVGNDEHLSEEHLRVMWMESMKSVNCPSAHISYEHFLLLMKGQTQELERSAPTIKSAPLGAVPEGESMGEVESTDLEPSSESKLPERISLLGVSDTPLVDPRNFELGNQSSLPNLPTPSMYDSSSSGIGVDGDSLEISNYPGTPDKQALQRKRSKSLENESAITQKDTEATPVSRGNARLALTLGDSKVNEALAKNSSALAVTRQLYRAHRQMRLSVLEASRRFEEEQARRARDALMAQKAKEAGLMGLGQAGLVMRHGHRVQVTTENIRQYLEDYRAEQQQLLEKATRRGGRGRANRKKTISDMSAMMNPSLGQDEMGDVAVKAARTPDSVKSVLNSSIGDLNVPDLSTPILPTSVNGGSSPPHRKGEKMHESLGPSLEVMDRAVRTATVPGQFHQTKDPFSAAGMYGGLVDVNKITSSPKQTKKKG